MAAPGDYKINIVGSDADPSLYAFVENTVQGVGFSSTGSTLQIGGQELSVSDVMNVLATGGDDAGCPWPRYPPRPPSGFWGKPSALRTIRSILAPRRGEPSINVNATASRARVDFDS